MQSESRESVLVLFGASGNSGRELAREYLRAGWNVVGVGRTRPEISHKRWHFISGDIRSKNTFSLLPERADLVVNFAAVQPSISPITEEDHFEDHMRLYLETNVFGTSNILNYVRKRSVGTYIFATTHRDIEGHWANGRFLRNDLPTDINFQGDHVLYAITKESGRMLGEYYAGHDGLRVFNLRLPMMFMVPDSPLYLRDGAQHVMPFLKIIRDASEGKDLEIWGDPTLKRDYVHVANLLQLVRLCFSSGLRGGTFSVGTGEAVTADRFVRAISHTFSPDGHETRFHYKPEKRTYKSAIYDVSEQRDLLGYNPILLDEMLTLIKSSLVAQNKFESWGWSNV